MLLAVLLLHADASAGSFALREQVLADVAALPGARAHVWFEDGGGADLPVQGVHDVFMDLDDLDDADLPPDALYYLCGPVPFMKAVRSARLERGVAARDVQYEVFGPDLWAADLAGVPAPWDRWSPEHHLSRSSATHPDRKAAR